MIRLLASIMAACVTTTAVAADAYLCVADAASGFIYQRDKGWVPTTLRTTNKYLLTKRSDGSGWDVKRVGEAAPVSWCNDGFTEAGLLICGGIPDFYFNRNNGRYMEVLTIGYWTDGVKNSSGQMMPGETTPSVGIGKCSPL